MIPVPSGPDLTPEERAYLIGLDSRLGAELLVRHMTGELATGVLVDDLLGSDGPYLESG